jgi:hypothetical protein
MQLWTLGMPAAGDRIASAWQYRQGIPLGTMLWWLNPSGCSGEARDCEVKRK